MKLLLKMLGQGMAGKRSGNSYNVCQKRVNNVFGSVLVSSCIKIHLLLAFLLPPFPHETLETKRQRGGGKLTTYAIFF